MAIHFEAEKETTIEGTGGGWIKIEQYDTDRQLFVIWLTVNQFERILGKSDQIIREALAAE